MSSVTDPTEYDAGTVPDDPLTGHCYDGIQEFDNPLPGWWKWLFVATIVIAPPYILYYHNGMSGRSLTQRYDAALANNMRLQFSAIGELKPDRETVTKFLYEPSWLQVGKTVFKTNCTSCHGNEGGGLVGPNLTDESYKNVKDIGDLITILQKGAAAGAMPAWQNRLSENELILTAAYVASMRGQNVEGGKAPEGQMIAPWPGPPAEDSSATAETLENENSP